MPYPTLWRAHSPSRDEYLFTGLDRAYVEGMTVHMNVTAFDLDRGAADWVLQEGSVTWRPA